MSINTNQCIFIKKNNERCKRIIPENENYCWQHIDIEISESLESVELLETLPYEVIQYILNPYIDYATESELIENLTNVKLDIDSHLTYKNKYYKNGKIYKLDTYLDLKLIKSECWYENANKWSIMNYKNDKLEGKYEVWYENGYKWTISNYKSGRLDGISEEWYPNGNKEYKRNYKNGRLEGIQEYWYQNGNKKSIENHKNGQFEGIQEYWYENGNIQYILNYKNGILEKILEDGHKNKETISIYKNGILIKSTK